MTAAKHSLGEPLDLIEHVLDVLRTDDDRDDAIERLIQDLEDERAKQLASRISRRRFDFPWPNRGAGRPQC
jgi:hypothetical protein